MASDKDIRDSRRNFLKGAGVASAAYVLGTVSLVGAEAEKDEVTLAEHWARKQKEYEALEEQARKEYKPFDSLLSMSTGERTTPTIRRPFTHPSRKSVNFCPSSSPFSRPARLGSTSDTL